jgi:hypothetical protein
MAMPHFIPITVIQLIAWIASALPVMANPPILARHTRPYHAASGLHRNDGRATVLAYETTIDGLDAPWIRVHFDDARLGPSSYVLMTSLLDGAQQRLDATALRQWNYVSALFNGDQVRIQLYVARGESNISVSIHAITVGEWIGFDDLELLRTLCGDDDRVPSGDNRVGRLIPIGCTAWRITTGAFLTAGHCVDVDPDRDGPKLPDGILDLDNSCVEFNVPPSMPDGTIVCADPDDQYPVNPDGVIWRFDGEGQGLGKDWAVMGIFPNSNTGLLPHEAYGFPLRMSRSNPDNGDEIRITGFGQDSTPPGSEGALNADNQTNQTSAGPYVGEFAVGDDIFHNYVVDTVGGNSGSPIFWTAYEITVGIHTAGGCGGGVGNNGTSFEVNALEDALISYIDSESQFVDSGHPFTVIPTGTPLYPFGTVSEAIEFVADGGVISIVAGDYPASAGNVFTAGADGRAMTLVAPVGTVRIGE